MVYVHFKFVLVHYKLLVGGRLFETCANLFKLVFGWALIRDVRLFETCANSSIYGNYDFSQVNIIH